MVRPKKTIQTFRIMPPETFRDEDDRERKNRTARQGKNKKEKWKGPRENRDEETETRGRNEAPLEEEVRKACYDRLKASSYWHTGLWIRWDKERLKKKVHWFVSL